MMLKQEKNLSDTSNEKSLEKSSSTGKYKGRPIWTVDAETDPFKKGRVPVPFIWGVYTGYEYYQFLNTDSLIEFLSDKEVICYAHNGGKFDWHFITEYIPDFEPLTIIAGRLAKFKIGECEFRDSYNLIPAPLSAYKKDDFDYTLLEKGVRNKPENWKRICEYLKNDCIYLHEMITAFVSDYGMNLTQAGAAMKTWSKMSGIKKPQSTAFYYESMARYYYGGRVECFETGVIKRKFKVIDIRSAYPYAMTFLHPWGMDYAVYDKMPENLTDKELGRCFITMNAMSLGAFPSREKTGLMFHNDGEIREFNITGWEFIAARDTDCLKDVKIIEVRKYEETIEFNEYVNHFFAMKDQAKIDGDKARYLFAKIFLNALYGKFASNPANYQEFMTLPASMIDASKSDGWNYCKLLCEETAVVQKPLNEEKQRFYDVAVSASITGFVRAYLFRAMKNCENVLYCDTDSIAASLIGNDIPDSGKLGDWESEGEFDLAAIAGKKLYAFRKVKGTFNPEKEKPWKVASKGVRLEPSDIIKIAEGETVVYEPEAPTFSVKRKPIFTPRKIKMQNAQK